MGNALEAGTQSQKGSHGRRWRLVRADWRSQHSTSSLAVRGSGGTESTERNELGCSGVGRYRAQDRATDREDEESDIDTNAMESGCIGTDWVHIVVGKRGL